MNEHIIYQNDNDEEIEKQQPIIIEEKKNNVNFVLLIIIFSILDIISLILALIFICLSIKSLFWVCFILILIFSILLGISINYKIKKDKIEQEEKRKLEEEERKRLLELEEQKKKEEEERKRLHELERKRKEEERLKEMKRKMLENQKKLRENNDNTNNNQDEKQVNQKINETLEDMCIYGKLMEKEIKEEKEKHPEKFVETSQALQSENNDSGLFALGLISNNLENIGIETAIEKDGNEEEEKDAGSACLQFITNGMCEKKAYDLHFDFGEKRNEELLDSEEEYEKFKNNLKLKLSKDYNIPMDQIVVTFPEKGSYRVQVIFQSNEFNNLDKNDFINKFKNDNEFKELSNLKEIHEDLVMKGCKLSKNQLDPRGNRNDGWGVGECRGGKPYNPPIGWNGIGLKVFDKYGNNTWLGMNNSPGEWCVVMGLVLVKIQIM